MSRRIATIEELARHVDFDSAPPGFRSVCIIDLAMHGPMTGRTLRHFIAAANWGAVARTETPDPPGDWADRAACLGQRMHYGAHQAHNARLSRDDRAFEQDALAICAACPVLAPCRAWALQHVEPAVDHVAGGLTPRQRHQYRLTGDRTWT